jgi:hypothetical protein
MPVDLALLAKGSRSVWSSQVNVKLNTEDHDPNEIKSNQITRVERATSGTKELLAEAK